MDRFEWSNGTLLPGENHVKQQPGVRLFDGTDKTAFDKGLAILTTHRLFWRDAIQQATMFGLPLSHVIFAEEVSDGRGKSPKIAVHLHPPSPGKSPGPVMSTVHSYIQLVFRDGGQSDFFRCVLEELSKRRWELTTPSRTAPGVPRGGRGGAKPRQIHAGIVGIERKLDEKRKETDQNISKAFEDLDKLMDKAKEMVNLTKTIANRIKEKQGEITEDETVQFKSYLLSLGIANPVTRETHGTGLKYHNELAKQLADVLVQPVEESGGMMALTDIYCRINRARGMELLSPDDLMDACRQFERLKLPLRLREFSSGVMVVELVSRGEEEAIKHIAVLLNDKGSLTADELSQGIGISVTLAKQRLMTAEETGEACRDESVEGLRFYPNLFLKPPPSR